MARDREDTAIHIAYDDYKAFDPLEPERNLLRAVLMSAMNDIKKGGAAGEEAKIFFMNIEDDYIYSFQSICQFLSLDPNTILRLVGIHPDSLT